MSAINKSDNMTSINFNGDTINNNSVETLLLLAPNITKSVDKATASIGDILTYTITITSISISIIKKGSAARLNFSRAAEP